MLTDAEYREIKQRESILQGNIEGAERDIVKYREMAEAARARKVDAEDRLLLYTNHLSSDVKEYEEAHKEVEPER